MPEEEGGNDEESLDLDTADLKKFLKKAKTKVLTFVYAPPAGSDGEGVFTLHNRKNPKALSKDVNDEKKEKGEKGTKVSFGKMEFKDDVLVLTCDKVVPGMEKKLTKLFREKRVQAKFKIVGPGGEEV